MDPLLLYLIRTDERTLDVLVRLFVERPCTAAARKAEIVKAMRNPRAVERVLQRLRPEALAALSVLIDAGDLVPRGALLAELHAALGSGGAPALEALAAAGLAFAATNGDRIGLPAPIAEVLAPFVPALEPLVEAQGESDALRFDEAVVLALLAGARPRVNRDGRVNVTDLRKLEKRIAGSPRIAHRFNLLVDALLDDDVLHIGDRLELLAKRAGQHLGQPFAAWYETIVRRPLRWWPAYRAYTLVSAAGAGWVPEESLLRVLRLQRMAWDRSDPREQLDRLVELLLLERSSDGRLVRAPQPPSPENGKLVVQPSFEVLAPPDTPPWVIAELGRFAELQHADRFATFRLSEAAAQLAIDEGASIDELVALLSAHAAHGVPQNVQHTLRRWTQKARRAVLSTGVAVYFDDAAQAAAAARALAAGQMDATALGDRVLVVPIWEQSRVRSLLRKLSMRVVERQPDEPPDLDEPAECPSAVDESGVRGQIPLQAARLQAELRPKMGTRARTEAAPPTRSSVSDLRATLERAAKRGDPLLVRAWDLERVVRVQRLRPRGANVYAEVATVEGDEAFSISLDAIVDAQPIASRGPLVSCDKVGRNDPCPCGSGKKYKRCCLGAASQLQS